MTPARLSAMRCVLIAVLCLFPHANAQTNGGVVLTLDEALEGGPLWKPLCYAQIGGLAVATFITLLLVPVFYSILVLDLKWIKWETTGDREQAPEAEPATT